mmetsp:Transcript_13029/g.40137  ORF Transcript_13029/g.40137 Transcript_13029/m.40137 type:complete len:442 (+) Transcript_13029:185-1510(+)
MSLSDGTLAAYRNSRDLYERIQLGDGLDDRFRGKLKVAVDTIESAIRLYGLRAVAIAFNGGKDATVILHLMRACLAKAAEETLSDGEEKSESRIATAARVISMYIVDKDEFPEVEEFVKKMCKAYAVDATDLFLNFKDSLSAFLNQRTEIAAFVLGTRYDDPDGRHVEHFSPSSKDWPRFMRINPILEWDYADVWQFLRHFELPYCVLYDQGYTSLGSVGTTGRNPELKCPDGSFQPAFQLTDKAMERAGRVSRSTLTCMEKPLITAGVVVISTDALSRGMAEISSADTNQMLRSHGIQLKKLSIVPNDLECAIDEIAAQVSKFDIVITTGGVGALKEDVTFAAVASAFNEDMCRSEAALSVIKSSHSRCNDLVQMVDLPASAEIVDNRNDNFMKATNGRKPALTFPVIKTKNVYSLPGTPMLFRFGLERIVEHISSNFDV